MISSSQGPPLSDEELARVLSHFPDGLLLCDPTGAILAVNQHAAMLLGADQQLPTHMNLVVPEINDWGDDGLLTMAEAGELEASFQYPPDPPAESQTLTLSVRASTIRNDTGDPRVLVSIRDISEERRLQERLRELSMTDELTGIPNRRFLRATLSFEEERARRFGRMLFVMFLDIDKFKLINDRYGHPVGDRAIKHFATVLADGIRRIDTVCRWGGDEFVIVGLCTTVDGALILLKRLIKAADRAPLPVDGESIRLRASIGMVLAHYGPDASMYGDALVAEADALMLQVKERESIRYLVGEMGVAAKESEAP